MGPLRLTSDGHVQKANHARKDLVFRFLLLNLGTQQSHSARVRGLKHGQVNALI